jgi:hypothetical protein
MAHKSMGVREMEATPLAASRPIRHASVTAATVAIAAQTAVHRDNICAVRVERPDMLRRIMTTRKMAVGTITTCSPWRPA